jgi:hypothetical protein
MHNSANAFVYRNLMKSLMYHIPYINSLFFLDFTFYASGRERPNPGCEFEEQWFSPTYMGSTKKVSARLRCSCAPLFAPFDYHVTSDNFCAVFGVQLSCLSLTQQNTFDLYNVGRLTTMVGGKYRL